MDEHLVKDQAAIRETPVGASPSYERLSPMPASSNAAGAEEQALSDSKLSNPVPSTVSFHQVPSSPPVGPSGQVAPIPDHPLIGRRIGHYQIQQPIGSGGMGSVYLAVRVDDFQQQVALKVIKGGLDTDEVLRRFRNERQVLAGLNHPNIARLLDGGTTDDGLPYFVMEYIRGQPLDHYCAAHQFGLRERLQLLLSVCAAVQYAHQHAVIHRDLKPGNILVDAAGRPKLLDFGVARVAAADLRATMQSTNVGQLIGTLPYMSPEQLAADPGLLDTRSDVYALGVIAYGLLADRLPHDIKGKSLPDAVRVLSETEPVPLRTVNSACRGDLDVIVGKALEKDKERRYQSAADLAADIERYLRDEPILARPASKWYQLRKFGRRNRALVGGAVTAVLALVLGIIGTSVGLVRARIAKAKALGNLDRAIQAEGNLRDELVQSQLRTAKLAAQRGDWRTALQAYDSALQSGAGDDVALRLKKIQAWTALDDRQRAQEELEALCRRTDLGPHEGAVLLIRGDFALSRFAGRDPALADIRAALDKGLETADAAYARGLLAEGSLEAVEHFQQALRHDPFHHHAHNALLTVLLSLGQRDECKSRAQALTLLFPEDPSPKFVIAIASLLEGDTAGARTRLGELEAQLGPAETKWLEENLTAVAEILGGLSAGDAFGVDQRGVQASLWKLAALRSKFPEMPELGYLGLGFQNLPCLANSWGALYAATTQSLFGNVQAAIQKLEPVLEQHPETMFYLLHGHLVMLQTDKAKGPEELGRVVRRAEHSYRRAMEAGCVLPPLARVARFFATYAQGLLATSSGRVVDAEMRDRAVQNMRWFLREGHLRSVGECAILVDIAGNRFHDYDLARSLVGAGESLAPDDLRLLRLRAQIELAAGAYHPAISAADKVLAREPADAEALRIRQEAAAKLQEQSKAANPRQ